MKLAGRGEVTAYDVNQISEDVVELSEEELKAVPFTHKRLVEGKVHVLGFDNKLVLKPVNTDATEDKTPPKLNKVKDYEKDGGDAVKMNKKMIDNETLEESDKLPYSPEVIKRAADHLEVRKSKLRDKTPQIHPDDKKTREDAEYEELMKRKKAKEVADHLLSKNSNLRLATENADVEDGTVFSGTEFSEEDRDDYLGRTEHLEVDVQLPPSVKAAAEKRVKEIEQSIKDFDDKGYNDGAGANSNKNKAIDAIEQILQNLSTNDLEGYKQAQLFFLTLMSPITDLMPASLVNFLANGGPGPEGTDEITTEVEPFETEVKESNTERRSLADILQESKKGRKKKMTGKDPCWKGYEMVGHKTKDGKEVPNCVPVNEQVGVTDYNPKSQGGTRKELLAKYAKSKDPKDAAAARKAGASNTELEAALKA